MSENKVFLKDQELENVNGGYTTTELYNFAVGETYEDGTYRYVVTKAVNNLGLYDGITVQRMKLNDLRDNRVMTVQVIQLVKNSRRV